MIITGKFTFYSIDACGYFKYGEDTPRFGNPRSCLEQLHQWVGSSGTALRDTCTFERDEQSDGLGVYCFDLERAAVSGDYLLITWNEISAVDGKTPVVNGGAPVGAARVKLSNFPADGIPGYPSYFWFLPEDSVFAVVTFDSVLNGHQNLLKYMTGFLRTHSAHVCRSVNEKGESEIDGYHLSVNDAPERLYPRFRSFRCRKKTSVEFIMDNREAVTKCIRKLEIESNSLENRDLLQRVFAHATGMDKKYSHSLPVKLRYEIDITPSEEELKAMIREWEKGRPRSGDDMGFTISDDGNRTRWLSQSFVRADFPLQLEAGSASTPDAASLLSAIESRRDVIRSVVAAGTQLFRDS